MELDESTFVRKLRGRPPREPRKVRPTWALMVLDLAIVIVALIACRLVF